MPQATDNVITLSKAAKGPDKPQNQPKGADSIQRPVYPGWSHAFFDMEPGLCDIVEMARLAVTSVHNAIGELEMKDGLSVSQIRDCDISTAMFAVHHLLDMIEELQENYEAALLQRA